MTPFQITPTAADLDTALRVAACFEGDDALTPDDVTREAVFMAELRVVDELLGMAGLGLQQDDDAFE